MATQRVNIDLDKELWRRASIRAAELGITKRELVESSSVRFVQVADLRELMPKEKPTGIRMKLA